MFQDYRGQHQDDIGEASRQEDSCHGGYLRTSVCNSHVCPLKYQEYWVHIDLLSDFTITPEEIDVKLKYDQ